MAAYLIVNRPPKGYTPSGDARAAWTAWFVRLGQNLADLGNPAFKVATLGNCGADTALGGYTLVTADSLEAAVALARDCPVLEQGGGVEVGEITILNRGTRAAGEDPA